MARRIGYARVSTDDQDLSIQKAALDRDGCAIVFEEKRSGTTRRSRAVGAGAQGADQGRHARRAAPRSARPLAARPCQHRPRDRAGRRASARHRAELDTATSAGRAFFGMLAVFAQFETDVRRERQAEGIAKAKKAGVYTGGKPRIDRTAVQAMDTGEGPAAVARTLGVSRMSVYRILAKAASSGSGRSGKGTGGHRSGVDARRRIGSA